MQNIYLQSIDLKNYRNFNNIQLEINNNSVIILGENGSGKTNILESISLIYPGRGLRGARFDEICKHGTNFWSSSFVLNSKIGLARIKTNFSSNAKSRKIEYNGSKIASNELADLSNIIWITPQTEGIFLGSSSLRRRFLDRIVYLFDSDHAKRVSAYEHYMHERLKLLTMQGSNEYKVLWLDSLEEKMSIEAEHINKNRGLTVTILQNEINELESDFTKAILQISSLVSFEDDQNAIDKDFLGYFQKKLNANRDLDKRTGRTNFGIHRSDLMVFHQENKQLAKLCSTGEQKALLINIILAQISYLISKKKITPILLLDELFVHLDQKRRDYLIDFILSYGMQSFVTTTDIVGIEKLVKASDIKNI